MLKTVLLDFDGTIANTEPGIISCAQYALSAFGIEEEDRDKLRRFIGPPLRQSFQQYYQASAEQADAMVAKFRERYTPIGLFESELYPDVREFMQFLKAAGYQTAVASSKPERMCLQLLEKFEIIEYFDEVAGATLDGKIDGKLQVLQEAFRRLSPKSLDEVVLIGDTRFDAIGGREAGIRVIGITYGFGTREELEAEGALVFENLSEVRQFLEADQHK